MAAVSRVIRHITVNLQRKVAVSNVQRVGLPWRPYHVTSVLQGDALQIKMPSLSPTMEQGTIVKWYKKEGDAVAAGDILCDIQTDKAVVGFEIEEDGTLAKILKPDDTKDVVVGTLIALIVEEGEDWQNVTVPAEAAAAPEPASPASAADVAPATAQPSTKEKHSAPIGPAVRALLEMYSINSQDVDNTGPQGRILKGDVLKHIKARGLQPVPPPTVPPPDTPKALTPTVSPTAAPAAPPAVKPPPAPPVAAVETEGYIDIPHTSMRAVIAKRLTESKTTIPHAYASIDCNIGQVMKMRKSLAADGIKVSVNDFIVKAAAVALQDVPEVNAVWGGEEPRLLSDIDISVAVATDDGLITPIVKDAIGKGVSDISESVRELAGRARQGKLQLHEFQGGSFTISNLGMFGITEFSAVINPPQACILAVGTSRLTVDLEGKPQTMMMVTLSSDARIVDDYLAQQFLESFREILENPMLMLSQGINKSKLFAK